MRLFSEDSVKDAKFPIVPEGISEVYVKGWNDAIDAIVNNAPTVERPKGKWIKITKNGTIPVEYICSVCGRKIFDIYEHQIPQSEFYPYCHCGADMREADDE